MNIGFFGCSFTEGGGLNSPVFNKYAIKHNLLPSKYKDKYEEVVEDYRFSALVGKKLECKVTNYGKSCASNESIINTLYENLEKHDISIVQFSVLSRKEIYDCESDEFWSVNGEGSHVPKNVVEYWVKTVTNHHNDDYELKKIEMFMKLFNNWKQNIFWIFHEDVSESVKRNKNLILFDGYCLGEYCDLNKLLLTHETDGFYNDRHYSLEGHKIISDKIVEFINDSKS